MLTDFQEQVAHLFLTMPEAAGYALAGGAALVLQGLVDRDTKDLDFFSSVHGQAVPTTEAFLRTLATAGLHGDIVRSSPTFARIRVHGADGDALLVEIGSDYRLADPVSSRVGPVLRSEELAADKLLALYGRAAARDFVDVYRLAGIHGVDAMLGWAADKDPGLDRYQLAVAMNTMDRHPRREFAVDDETLTAMREFFAQLRADLVQASLEGPGR